MSRRQDTLSFTHHAELAGLAEPEQDFWLRREVKTSMLERTKDNELEPGRSQPSEDTAALLPEDTAMLRVSIATDNLNSCYEAASKLGLGVEARAEQILVTAAQRTLNRSANNNVG